MYSLSRKWSCLLRFVRIVIYEDILFPSWSGVSICYISNHICINQLSIIQQLLKQQLAVKLKSQECTVSCTVHSTCVLICLSLLLLCAHCLLFMSSEVSRLSTLPMKLSVQEKSTSAIASCYDSSLLLATDQFESW